MAIATKPKPKGTAHKKRQAKHHKQGKHYVKTYWPYMPMLLIVGVGLLINSAWSSQGVLGKTADLSHAKLLKETNEERSAAQLATLNLDPQLSAAAQAKAEDMVANNYWSHNSPEGKTPWTFIAGSGYQYQSAGENLAYGFDNADQVVAGWMNSPQHRANILSNSYSDVGFGVASSPSFQGRGPQTIVVAEYGKPVDAVATIRFTVPEQTAPAEVKGDTTEAPAKTVSRVETLTGGKAAWSLIAVSALAGAALMLFIVRHGYRIHRMINRGEMFIVHHPYLDIAFVAVIVAGFILTRSSGLIR